MDANALRNWGLGVGGALTAGAVALALVAGNPAPPPQSALPVTAGPLPPRVSAAAPEPVAPSLAAPKAGLVAEPAALIPARPPAGLSFLVHFAETHALGRAHALAAQGDMLQAGQTAARAIAATRDLRGLCFDRFTAGGAEIVLRVCPDAPASVQGLDAEAWRARFASMAGVDYADVNLTAEPARGAR